MRLLSTLLFAGVLATGCMPSALVVNGASKHLTQTGKDHSNLGLGVRYNNTEVGFFDNSRVYESYSYYVSQRVWQQGRYFFDTGVAYYDDLGKYNEHVAPILMFGAKFGPLEVGVTPKDIVVGKVVF